MPQPLPIQHFRTIGSFDGGIDNIETTRQTTQPAELDANRLTPEIQQQSKPHHTALPFFFDLALAKVKIQRTPTNTQVTPDPQAKARETVCQHLFSPGTLMPSIQNTNPTVFLKPEHWVDILAFINSGDQNNDAFFEILTRDLEVSINAAKATVAKEKQTLANTIKNSTIGYEKCKKDLQCLYGKNRHYQKDPNLLCIANRLEAEKQSAQRTKKESKGVLRKLEHDTHSWPTQEKLRTFIKDLKAIPKIQATVLILKLVESKFSAEQLTDFQDAAQQSVATNEIIWRPLSAPEREILQHISFTNTFRQFSEPDIAERFEFDGFSVKAGDCVETTINNFLKTIMEARPADQSLEAWQSSLGISHLASLIDLAMTEDTTEKHLAFARLLKETPGFSPERRSDKGCIKAGATYEKLTSLLGTTPAVIIKATGVLTVTAAPPTHNHFSATTPKGSHFELQDDEIHTEWVFTRNTQENHPVFLTDIRDTDITANITNLLLLHYGTDTLQNTFLEYFNANLPVALSVTRMRQWPLASHMFIKTDEPHPIYALAFDDFSHSKDTAFYRRNIKDVQATLNLIKQSNHLVSALIYVLGPYQAIVHLDPILKDDNLKKALVTAMDQSENFRTIFWQHLRADNKDFVQSAWLETENPNMTEKEHISALAYTYLNHLNLDPSQFENWKDLGFRMYRHCQQVVSQYY